MKLYRVALVEKWDVSMGGIRYHFDCFANSEEEAREKASRENPTDEIVEVYAL